MKYLLFSFSLCTYLAAAQTQPPRPTGIPGTVIAYQEASTKQYIGSPSLAVLSNGDYVASHDFFGPESSEFVQAVSRIYRSSDKGNTWKLVSEIRGAFWSSLFVHRGSLYFLGPDRHHGTVLIRRSDDGGSTWTQPTGTENGLLLKGMYHCAPMPVIEHNGRLWRAMETAHGPVLQWGKRYGAMMMSVPADADLLNAGSWTTSNSLLYDSTYLDGNFTGWLEGNAVATPTGDIVDILRVDNKKSLDEKAAIVHISPDGKKATFDPDKDFIRFPGGSKKFAIRYDAKSGRYWTLTNHIPDDVKAQYPSRNPASIRNTLALASSGDLKSWTVHTILLKHPDVEKHGFQYVDWLFEGNDIIWVCRTAADDGKTGARNNHDANFLTFHRLPSFRNHAR